MGEAGLPAGARPCDGAPWAGWAGIRSRKSSRPAGCGRTTWRTEGTSATARPPTRRRTSRSPGTAGCQRQSRRGDSRWGRGQGPGRSNQGRLKGGQVEGQCSVWPGAAQCGTRTGRSAPVAVSRRSFFPVRFSCCRLTVRALECHTREQSYRQGLGACRLPNHGCTWLTCNVLLREIQDR